MANIRIDVSSPVYDGQPVTFRSPANCAEVTGLIVYYPNGDTTASKTLQFADAHGNNVGSKNLFAENVLVKVILDTELNRAYVQNADTNAYLEAELAKKYSPTNKPSPSDIGASAKPSFVTATMNASGWSSKKYSFESTYPKASYDISIEVAPTATAEQFEAFGAAMICGSHNSNIATALGDVPTVNIPIIIKVVAK